MSPWFAYPKATAAPRLGMVCLPYAGGAASVFRGWQALVPPGVEVWPVQYPGRETRWKEPPLRRMEELVPTLVEALRPLQERPFVLFGHSLGALVAFELAR